MKKSVPIKKKPITVKAKPKLSHKKLSSVPIKKQTVQRQPKLPFLHKKRYAIPLLVLAVAIILFLLALPLLPQAQSLAQSYTTKHPVIAKIVPSSFKPPNLSVPNTGNWLVIPKASIKLPIVEGSSINVLVNEVGVWHQTGDLANNYVIAGHKLQYFRTVNQSLYHLTDLSVGDTGVYVVVNGLQHEYQVTSAQVVDKTDVAILDQTPTPMLTIYTCNDFFNHQRFTITATPIAEN